MEFNLECPINPLSLGQVSVGLLIECYKQGLKPNVYNIGNVDLSPYNLPDGFVDWLKHSINNAIKSIDKKLPTIAIWHINGSHKMIASKRNVLWTAHECDSLTPVEKSICGLYDKVLVTSEWSRNTFNENGIDASFCPDYFDANSFFKKDIRKQEGVVNFLLCGKFEKRKLTKEIISLWSILFGNNSKYRLNCLVHNPFLQPAVYEGAIQAMFKGNIPSNINFLPFLDKNEKVNDLLNFIDIDISGLSGSEGWNLPAFNAICMGKTAVVMNAHGHQSYATKDNAILVEPGDKTPIYDDVFFVKGQDYNQGNMYSMNIEATKNALLESVSGSFKNNHGEELANKFSVSNTLNTLLSSI